MRVPRTLQTRLALGLGLLITLLWIGAASITALLVRSELDEVFDSSLQETAQRILPLAVMDIISREDDDEGPQRLGAMREHNEHFTYLVRDAAGNILLQSHAADPTIFPPFDGPGFRQTKTHRLYNEAALQGSVLVTVAEPLRHRANAARELQIGLGLPILVVIPITLIAVTFAVRSNLTPLRRFRDALAARTARDLSPIPHPGLPGEIAPIADTLNDLLERLKAAFEAERSFAANAAHELRTPLAGAIAQAQRLRAETSDPDAAHRADEIATALKRLTRISERLMQMARAEGGRLKADQPSDLRTVARIIVDDVGRRTDAQRISLIVPDQPVMSDLDPDAFGILCRNLIENALAHGTPGATVDVTLTRDGTFCVANDGPLVPAEKLERLTDRFERASSDTDGSGLGLAIVAAIAKRSGSRLALRSPRSGSNSGFEAMVHLPAESAEC